MFFDSLRFSTYIITLLPNKDSFISSFQIYIIILFIFLLHEKMKSPRDQLHNSIIVVNNTQHCSIHLIIC